ncbi:MAG: hypothetical protein AB1555_09275 [Nitrospirota bacterium]
MAANTLQKRTSQKAYKLRGTLVGLDLVHHTIVIQPSEHDGKRVRRLDVRPDSEILAGDERKTLADLIVGDWVSAQFVKEGEHEVLKRLHIPRGMGAPSSHQPEQGDMTPAAGNEPLSKAS